MFPFTSKPEARPTFEDVFFEHYARLFESAMQLSGRNRSDAEDLIQELYIRFAGVIPISEHIANAKDYLFTALRHLHYARVRRARTGILDDLSVVDYDSAERGLKAVDRNNLLFVREDLHRICGYVCARKNTSRAAGIFILRFFLGYFPNEVMQVVRSTRSAVDKAVAVTRTEARLELANPGIPKCSLPAGHIREQPARVSEDSQELFSALRSKIFRSRFGVCFTPQALEERYETSPESFTTAEVAHLVSCSACLDRANRKLGLPLLAERSPDETIGRDNANGPGSASSSPLRLVVSRSKRKPASAQRLQQRLERSLQEAHQHRPARLLIAVDGDLRASQRITAQLSELRVELRQLDKPTFIEVLSEQSICLAFIPVQVPIVEGGLCQLTQVQLSDARFMEVSINFTSECPAIQVVYSDPLMALQDESEPEQWSLVSRPQPTVSSLALMESKQSRLSVFMRWLVSRTSAIKMNPLLAGAMLFALCSTVCFLLWSKSPTRVSAETFLARAQESDALAARGSNSEMIRQKVQIRSKGDAATVTLYRGGTGKHYLQPQPLNADERAMKNRLSAAGVNWDEPLSAEDYRAWRDRQSLRRDTIASKGGELLTLTTVTAKNSDVVQQSLTVRTLDFHPVDRTIELRDQSTIEIVELNYDVLPFSAATPPWLVAPASPVVSDVGGAQPRFHVPHVVSDVDLDQAELSAQIVLHQLQADTGEQIHVTRGSNSVEIKGVVTTDARKQELLAQLALVQHVHPTLLSVEELGNRPARGSMLDEERGIHAYAFDAQPSPLERYLREKNMPLEQLSVVSQALLDNALAAQQAAVHLTKLRKQFADGNRLPTDQQAKLEELCRNYARTIQSALDRNARTLSAIGLKDREANPPAPQNTAPSDDLAQRVLQYQELCQKLIAGDTATSASAETIAFSLERSGALIRSSTD